MTENTSRLRAFTAALRAGRAQTIGFIGGSITQGSLSSAPAYSYAGRVFSHLKKRCPQAALSCVNAGIGATNSYFGAARAGADLLAARPNLVIIDFSVNDKDTPFFTQTFEGLVRKIFNAPSSPALLVLGNVFYDTGRSAEAAHRQVTDYYHLPYLSLKERVYRNILNGKYRLEDITPDGLHPNDFGHGLVAAEIINFFENEAFPASEPFKSVPLTPNAYENAAYLNRHTLHPVSSSFTEDTRSKADVRDVFKDGWFSGPGGHIAFETEAAHIGVLYRKSVCRPACRAELTIDDHAPILLDGNFEKDWGDCPYLQPVMQAKTRKKRRIALRVLEDTAALQTPFYLAGLVVS